MITSSIFLSLILAISSITATIPPASDSLTVSSLFQDHMVLQQNDTVSVWGTSAPDANVFVKTPWDSVFQASADNNGHWKVGIPTPGAGGPYTMIITSGQNTISIEDIYTGEVWLASGQSNMEMPLEGWPPSDTINNSAREIAEANYPEIRMFTVRRAVSDTLNSGVSGNWEICTPQNAPNFSAAAYFFARKIHNELQVPVGIIHSSWGGTPAESWVSKEGLRTIGDFNNQLDLVEESRDERHAVEQWLKQLETLGTDREIPPGQWAALDLHDSTAANPNLQDSAWYTMDLPTAWENAEPGPFDGVVWFRKEFVIEKKTDGTYTLGLGTIDDMDVTYVNGFRIGGYTETGHWNTKRVYTIPDTLIKQGRNTIAVKVMDNQGGGGIDGNAKDMFLKDAAGNSINLAGTWKYMPAAEYRGGQLYVFGIDPSKFPDRPTAPMQLTDDTPSSLFNAMIAPLTNYTIRGAIWYQGESNVGRSDQYEQLFPTLIENWRTHWGYQFPFYFVQIAPWPYGGDASGNPESPALRDAQRKTLQLPKTGMAVTLDIGSTETIHPGNKQDVGKRLALWALAQTYDRELVYSGPLIKDVKKRGKKLILSFDHTGSGLELRGDSTRIFEIAGDDGQFTKTDGTVKNNRIIIKSNSVNNPVWVRYGWQDTAEAVLFNKEGLPASSFKVSVAD